MITVPHMVENVLTIILYEITKSIYVICVVFTKLFQRSHLINKPCNATKIE